MAVRGQRPTPTALRLVTGNAGHRPMPKDEPQPEGPVEKPTNLLPEESDIWDRTIKRCFWLTWADSPKAHVWTVLQAIFERDPDGCTNGRITQLRLLGSELGLDPASRARVSTGREDPNKSNDVTRKYF